MFVWNVHSVEKKNCLFYVFTSCNNIIFFIIWTLQFSHSFICSIRMEFFFASEQIKRISMTNTCFICCNDNKKHKTNEHKANSLKLSNKLYHLVLSNAHSLCVTIARSCSQIFILCVYVCWKLDFISTISVKLCLFYHNIYLFCFYFHFGYFASFGTCTRLQCWFHHVENFLATKTKTNSTLDISVCPCVCCVQRRYLQHLKQSGALTMGHILCLRHLMIHKLVRWCIRGLIVALLWLCKVLVVHRFRKRERYVIQHPAHEIPMFNCGSQMLAIQMHYEYGPLNRRSHWTDSEYKAFQAFFFWFFFLISCNLTFVNSCNCYPCRIIFVF